MTENSHPGFLPFAALRLNANGISDTNDQVAEETAVALSYNGISHAVMMATPRDLEDFAIGFSLSEGIVAHADEITDIEQSSASGGITVAMRVTERRMLALRERRRSLTGRTGCGLCGAESLEQAIRPVAQVTSSLSVTPAMIRDGFARLSLQQTLNHATGAMHAAALVSNTACVVREDIGRHNALDKLIGATRGEGMRDGFLLITSRASYEMVSKAASANIALMAAISAPTSLAIELAREAGITLIGFARGDSLTCYTQGRGHLET